MFQANDRYTNISELAQGGMAVVYKAEDVRFNRPVAIKVLSNETLLADQSFLVRFQQEARVIATLEHSAIVPVYDYGIIDNQPFLVMRYMPNGSLVNRLEEGPLSLEEAIPILHRVADALNYAHQKSILHRDIKPGNVLFDESGDAYLADFGAARVLEESDEETVARLTTYGNVIGTATYMSPEQLLGKELTPRSDVYSFGVMVFEMLSGEVPFQGDTALQTAVKHITAPVPRILDIRSDLHSDLDQIIDKVLAKEPMDRYESAGTLIDDLEEVAKERFETDIRFEPSPEPEPPKQELPPKPEPPKQEIVPPKPEPVPVAKYEVLQDPRTEYYASQSQMKAQQIADNTRTYTIVAWLIVFFGLGFISIPLWIYSYYKAGKAQEMVGNPASEVYAKAGKTRTWSLLGLLIPGACCGLVFCSLIIGS